MGGARQRAFANRSRLHPGRPSPFPSSSLPPFRGEVRWGVRGNARLPTALAYTPIAPPTIPAHSPSSPPTLRHSCAPPVIPAPLPPFLRRQEPSRPQSLGRAPLSRHLQRQPSLSPPRHTPNNPEQIRTNLNTAERPDQIGSTPRSPPNTPKTKPEHCRRTPPIIPAPLAYTPIASPIIPAPLAYTPIASPIIPASLAYTPIASPTIPAHSPTIPAHPPIIPAPLPSFLRRQEPSACNGPSHHLSCPAARKQPWRAVETSRRVLRAEAASLPACAGMTEA